jgi:hypothetical protein
MTSRALKAALAAVLSLTLLLGLTAAVDVALDLPTDALTDTADTADTADASVVLDLSDAVEVHTTSYCGHHSSYVEQTWWGAWYYAKFEWHYNTASGAHMHVYSHYRQAFDGRWRWAHNAARNCRFW